MTDRTHPHLTLIRPVADLAVAPGPRGAAEGDPVRAFAQSLARAFGSWEAAAESIATPDGLMTYSVAPLGDRTLAVFIPAGAPGGGPRLVLDESVEAAGELIRYLSLSIAHFFLRHEAGEYFIYRRHQPLIAIDFPTQNGRRASLEQHEAESFVAAFDEAVGRPRRASGKL